MALSNNKSIINYQLLDRTLLNFVLLLHQGDLRLFSSLKTHRLLLAQCPSPAVSRVLSSPLDFNSGVLYLSTEHPLFYKSHPTQHRLPPLTTPRETNT